ncbi:MAG: hypothetical protein ABII88_05005 [Candidatus Omnitrophota bacterium]
MKKNKLLILLVTGGMIFMFVTENYAQMKNSDPQKKTPAKQTATVKQPAPAVFRVNGKVTNCNVKNSTLSVTSLEGKQIVLTIGKSTAITKNGKNINLESIKTNAVIMASYEQKNGVNTAKNINVQ